MVGIAVWKHVETDGLMQRSGWERAVVGFAEQGRAEADGCRHNGTSTGAAKRTRGRGGGPRGARGIPKAVKV